MMMMMVSFAIIAAEPGDFAVPAPSASAPIFSPASAAAASSSLDLYVRSLDPTVEERAEIDAIALLLLEAATDLQLGLVERAGQRYEQAINRVAAIPKEQRKRLAESLRPVVTRIRELSNSMLKALAELSETTLSATAASAPRLDPQRN